ncbi:hypothetical protein I4U23_027718 [Adineta vaga]|nr:hypothetical protein I4U23_027718 [Adineta vaga]
MRFLAICILVLVVLSIFVNGETGTKGKSETKQLTRNSSNPTLAKDLKPVGRRRIGKLGKACKIQCAKQTTDETAKASEESKKQCLRDCIHNKLKQKKAQKTSS